MDIAKTQDVRDLLLQQFAKEAKLDTQQDPEFQDVNMKLHHQETTTHSRELTKVGELVLLFKGCQCSRISHFCSSFH